MDEQLIPAYLDKLTKKELLVLFMLAEAFKGSNEDMKLKFNLAVSRAEILEKELRKLYPKGSAHNPM